MSAAARYTAYYCEENVWHWCDTADELGLADPHAVFISSPSRCVAMWNQRLAADPGKPMVWDYHVVLLARRDDQWVIFDLDCMIPQLAVSDWVAASFPFAGVIPPELEPMFRVVGWTTLESEFRSDRSHMRNEDGSWKAAPPDWPTIGEGGSNLWDFVDPTADAPGQVCDLSQFLEDYARS